MSLGVLEKPQPSAQAASLRRVISDIQAILTLIEERLARWNRLGSQEKVAHLSVHSLRGAQPQ